MAGDSAYSDLVTTTHLHDKLKHLLILLFVPVGPYFLALFAPVHLFLSLMCPLTEETETIITCFHNQDPVELV